jgi:formamidopyrimidine-DNA glycosylase
MPEVPEVEAIARNLSTRLAGAIIEKLTVYSISALKTADPPVSSLNGATIDGCSRRGKFLLFNAGVILAVHFARAGWVRWSDELKKPERPSMRGPLAAKLFLGDGRGLSFTEQGTQKRLAIYVARQPDDIPGIARLGPDVLSDDFTIDVLTEALAAGGTAKAAISDQTRISGIGNAYSDEILHTARLSPFAPAKKMTTDQVARLYATSREVIADAVARAAGLELKDLKDDKRSHLRVHARDGEACPVCGTTIRSVHYATRSLQYCPGCQTGGKVLADRRLSKLLR